MVDQPGGQCAGVGHVCRHPARAPPLCPAVHGDLHLPADHVGQDQGQEGGGRAFGHCYSQRSQLPLK